MLGFIKRYATDTSGATAVEYALIASLIAVFIITALQTVGAQMSTVLTGIGNAMK